MTLSALNIFVKHPPGFSLEGGGGHKRLCAWAHNIYSPKDGLPKDSPKSLYGQGPGLTALDPLSCYLSLTFKHSDTTFKGGGGSVPVATLLDLQLEVKYSTSVFSILIVLP